MRAYGVSSGRLPQSARWARFAITAALGCIVFTGCSSESNTSSDAPSATSVQPTPASTDRTPAATSAGPSTSLPSPVDRPCRFEGKDLNDYKSIVVSFDGYFNGLLDNVLSKQYKASAADLAPLDQRVDLLIARLQAGEMKQTPDGINVLQDMDSITSQANAIVEAAMKAHPDLSPEMSPPALRASLKRQRDRLERVAIICIQRNAAG
jgi:hypothetical protein